MNRKFGRIAGVAAFALLACSSSWAQQDLSPQVVQQINAITAVKATFTAAQKKMDSQLAYGVLAAANDSRIAGFRNVVTRVGSGDVKVDITGSVSPELLRAVTDAGGVVLFQSAEFGAITATLPITAVSAIADRQDVKRIRLTPARKTNVGAVTSQGYIAHEANKVVNTLGYNGAGVTVGVLSDSASAASIAALIATGDLPPGTHALAGQDGAPGSDEGTAMMEIVHDVAPGASLIFATAFVSPASFAANIIALATAGCKVIVDDVSYSDEGVFQDSLIAQAVNTVTAMGVTYFSSAGNDGSLTFGTSSTWEGDFLSGGAAGGVLAGTGLVHDFGGQNYNVLTSSPLDVSVRWSDPLGGATNDYDLYILNAAGTAIIDASTAVQDGTQDPIEEVFNGGGYATGSRVVVVLFSGATRALHVSTFIGGTLSINTQGATIGHNAAANAVTLAATYWNSAKTGLKPFTGAANPNEIFSSDGPRKIFYNPNGTVITPGNVLFATNGGTTLVKPDLAASNGGSNLTPGFLPFFGTSASAPHAAGIAALILQAKPSYTVPQIKTAMTATALDSMAPGVDRDSGYGIAMGFGAVQYALTH
ncbi:MAG: S8 family serine peptidase [Casimicrobiaceae bacterium]